MSIGTKIRMETYMDEPTVNLKVTLEEAIEMIIRKKAYWANGSGIRISNEGINRAINEIVQIIEKQ